MLHIYLVLYGLQSGFLSLPISPLREAFTPLIAPIVRTRRLGLIEAVRLAHAAGSWQSFVLEVLPTTPSQCLSSTRHPTYHKPSGVEEATEVQSLGDTVVD